MKTIQLLLLIGIVPLLLFTGCAKKGCTDPLSYSYDSDAKEDDGSCKYYYGGKNYGQLDVGAELDLDNEYDVYFNGNLIGRSLFYFPNGLSCGNVNAVGKILPSGMHTIRAVGNGGTEIREGTVDLAPQKCRVVLIENLAIISNNGGGGGGGGGDTGDITFWVNADYGCGNIYVELYSVGTGTITDFYTGNPGCRTSGCANFNDLPFGNYHYSAYSDGTCTWNGGSIELNSYCSTMQLYL